ncbi:hypothetical protein D3C81_587440 [compost metagenome]
MELGIGKGYLTKKFAENNTKKVERFNKYLKIIKEALEVYNIKVTAGEIFNSGYQGFTFYVKGIKCLIIEQDGKTGLEDHSIGYVEVMVKESRNIIIKHRDRRFGDTRLNEEELKWVEENVVDEVIKLLVINGVKI